MTSKLEAYLGNELYTRFGQYSIRQNYKPAWLTSSTGTRLELDFYIDELKLAAEVQGDQHYQYSEFFHKSLAGFDDQRRRDTEKQVQCKHNGVELIEVFNFFDADLFVKLVAEKSKPQKKYFYQERTEDTDLDIFDMFPEIQAAARRARRAILRAKGVNKNNEMGRITRLVARVVYLCMMKRKDLKVKEIVEFYSDNYYQVNRKLEGVMCITCGKQRQQLFSADALPEHYQAKH